MSDIHPIKIKKGYANGSLKLSDDGDTTARKTDLIVWNIKDDIEVSSITGITTKSGPNIFVSPPAPYPGSGGKIWTAQIMDSPPLLPPYEYSIHWTGSYGNKTYDPKISINPSITNDKGFLKPWLIPGIVGLLAVSLLLWSKKKNNECF